MATKRTILKKHSKNCLTYYFIITETLATQGSMIFQDRPSQCTSWHQQNCTSAVHVLSNSSTTHFIGTVTLHAVNIERTYTLCPQAFRRRACPRIVWDNARFAHKSSSALFQPAWLHSHGNILAYAERTRIPSEKQCKAFLVLPCLMALLPVPI